MRCNRPTYIMSVGMGKDCITGGNSNSNMCDCENLCTVGRMHTLYGQFLLLSICNGWPAHMRCKWLCDYQSCKFMLATGL